ncbi:hypothetical protein VE00_00647 [Pseudogymnoascus sp. WSF 3629]|nr:hypothetical protein VE00_00647 [Pseudogymnoascus sp. WSF 3629]
MAEQFVGLTMLVTLSSPLDAQLRGRVSSVVAGQSLTLSDVYCPSNGKYITEITIQASHIKDLAEAGNENTAPNPAIQPAVQAAAHPRTQSIARTKQSSFEDPAIVSVGRPSLSHPLAITPIPTPPVFTPELDSSKPTTTSTSIPPYPAPPAVHMSRNPSAIKVAQQERPVTPAAILIDPMSNLELGNEKEDELANGDAEVAAKERHNKRRRGRGAKGARRGRGVEGTDGEEGVTPVTETNRSKGWRQTPLLEPNPSFQPFATLKRGARGGGKGYDNGWATEDATDVQDMGDFDFEASLSKFDKRTVFEGIRADDVTADEDRLVGHNRIPKPGTMGGRNLHPTENVLDNIGRAQLPPAWNSEAGDSEDAENMMGVSQRGSGSGRTSRRAESRLRMPMSKKETSSLHSQSRQSISAAPRAKSRAPPSSPPQATTKSSFYLVPADRQVEVASALQMLNLENIANSELGLTEDMMTENAARGIAEVALSTLSLGGGRHRTTQRKGNTLPYVVIYAGNSKSGIRAIAAGRHLRNHGATVAVCVLGLEREPELLEGVRRQLKVFRSFGGKVFTKIELMDYLKSTNVPVELIIDGLLGLTISFEELRTGDQATAFELIEWANRSKAAVLALDIPTGLDPGTGLPMQIDGRELWIQASLVVSLGVPKTGLLEAMKVGLGTSEGGGEAWRLWVVDIGIAKNVWKKSGMRMRRGVEFEGTWVVGMRFQKGAD